MRALRHRLGLTLEVAAERMQLDLKHLQKVEAGQGNVTLVTLVRIAMGLEVEVYELFGLDGHEASSSFERSATATDAGRVYEAEPPAMSIAADANAEEANDGESKEDDDETR